MSKGLLKYLERRSEYLIYYKSIIISLISTAFPLVHEIVAIDKIAKQTFIKLQIKIDLRISTFYCLNVIVKINYNIFHVLSAYR